MKIIDERVKPRNMLTNKGDLIITDTHKIYLLVWNNNSLMYELVDLDKNIIAMTYKDIPRLVVGEMYPSLGLIKAIIPNSQLELVIKG